MERKLQMRHFANFQTLWNSSRREVNWIDIISNHQKMHYVNSKFIFRPAAARTTTINSTVQKKWNGKWGEKIHDKSRRRRQQGLWCSGMPEYIVFFASRRVFFGQNEFLVYNRLFWPSLNLCWLKWMENSGIYFLKKEYLNFCTKMNV